MLTESEKTAIIGYILYTHHVWVTYNRINSLKKSKLTPLIDNNMLTIPDMSENVVSIILNKIQLLISLEIYAKI